MEFYKRTNGDLGIYTIDGIDLNNDESDRNYFKGLISTLFTTGDEVFFFFRNQEFLTKKIELEILKNEICQRFNKCGNFSFLTKLDEVRFVAIGSLTYSSDTLDFILDLWRYFRACVFFKPINELTFDEYEDYLICNGIDDAYGLRQLWDRLCNFCCIKGTGGDYLLLSYNSLELNIDLMDK